MAKIKHTKNELKAQRDALRRYERFLPMLLLKKQQLQAEIQAITARYEEKVLEEKRIRDELRQWVKLFGEPVDLDQMFAVEDIQTEEGNIAGVAIPVFKDIRLKQSEPDLFTTPAWVDDALDTLATIARVRAERKILAEQRNCVAEELRVTSQRVNLFEKVKIPECKEHIRVIKIFLGDEQTASVARGKIAKKRSEVTQG